MIIGNIRKPIFLMLVISLAAAPAISFEQFSFEQPQNNTSSSGSIEEQGRSLPSWNFAAVGDWDCNANALATVDNIASKEPELVLSLGDFSYQATADCWFDIIQPIDSKMKIVIGNHDDNTTTLLNQYMNHFNLEKQYYSFNYQNVHFVAMSSELPLLTGSDQYNFVRNDLTNATSDPNIDWIVVFVHQPLYPTPPHAVEQDLTNTYHYLFDKYDVDLVLQGHVHHYQRTHALMYNCTGPTSPIITSNDTGVYQNPEGQIYVTVGTGGRPIDASLEEDTPYEIITRDTFGALNIDVMDDQGGKEILSSKFIANNGTLIDQFNITKTRDNSSSSSTNTPLLNSSSSSPSVASEEANNNLRFNGCRYEAVPSNTSLQPINYSIAAWFKTNPDNPTDTYIINKGGVGGENPGQNMNFGLFMTRGEKIKGGFETMTGEDYFVNSSSSYEDGLWHYAVLTYNGSTLKLYVDGIEVAATPTGGAVPDNTGRDPVVIGATSRGLDKYFTGNIDEVRIWNRAITSTEVADQYTNETFNPSGQVLYLPLDEWQR
jgi:predicted phosphodiesterase